MAQFLQAAEAALGQHKTGIEVGLAAVAATAAAGGAFALYQHHETDVQKRANSRLKIVLVSGKELHSSGKEIYVVFHQGHLGVRSASSNDADPDFAGQEFELGILDKSKPLGVEVHEHGALHDANLGKANVNLNDLSSSLSEQTVELKPHGILKLKLSLADNA